MQKSFNVKVISGLTLILFLLNISFPEISRLSFHRGNRLILEYFTPYVAKLKGAFPPFSNPYSTVCNRSAMLSVRLKHRKEISYQQLQHLFFSKNILKLKYIKPFFRSDILFGDQYNKSWRLFLHYFCSKEISHFFLQQVVCPISVPILGGLKPGQFQKDFFLIKHLPSTFYSLMKLFISFFS